MTPAARYLSFNETFTPACVGWLPAGEASAPEQGAPGKRRKPDHGEMQLVYYVGVALGTAILVDWGKQRKVLGQVVSGVLAHVPSLVSRYSLGYGRTVALFQLSQGYTFFSVADESLGRHRGFEVLGQVRDAFLECLARSASAASSVSSASWPEAPWPASGVPSASGPGARWKGGASASVGGTSGGAHGEGKEEGGEGEEAWVVRRLPRSRSASQVSGFMAEAMASRFEEIVGACKGKVVPKPKLEAYPDAPHAYLTTKKSVHEPDLLEREPGPAGGAPGAAGGAVSARESLMSEIADMLKEVDWPRPQEGAGEGKRKGWGGAEGGGEAGAQAVGQEEEEEEERIPGMHLLAAGRAGHDTWFSVGGSAAWGPHAQRATGAAVPAGPAPGTFVPLDRHGGKGQGRLPEAVELPLRPSSSMLPSRIIFTDDEEGDRDAGRGGRPRAAWRHARRERRSSALSAQAQAQGVTKTVSMTAHEGVPQGARGDPDGAGGEGPEEGAPVAGRARQRLRMLALDRFGGWRGGAGARGEAGEEGGGGGGTGAGGSVNSSAFGDRGGGGRMPQLPSFRSALSSVFHRDAPAAPSRLSVPPTSLDVAPSSLALQSPRAMRFTGTVHSGGFSVGNTSAGTVMEGIPPARVTPETLASVEEACPMVSPRQTSGAPQDAQAPDEEAPGPVQVQAGPRSTLWRGMEGGGSAVERGEEGGSAGQAAAGPGMGMGAGGRPPPLWRHASGVPSVSPQETPQSLLGPLFSPFRRTPGHTGGAPEPPESPASASGSSASGGHAGGRGSWRSAARAALTGWHRDEGPALGRSSTGSRDSPGASAGTPREGSGRSRRRNNFGL